MYQQLVIYTLCIVPKAINKIFLQSPLLLIIEFISLYGTFYL